MASEAWWLAYLMVTIPAVVIAIVAIAVGVWANHDTGGEDRDQHPHIPAE